MIVFLGALLCLSYVAQGQNNTVLPIRMSPIVLSSNGLTCSNVNYSAHREAVRQALQDYYMPSIPRAPPCSCGAAGNWTRAVYLNMSDPNHQCPTNWTLVSSPVRGCGRTTSSSIACDSVTYGVGRTYSNVCGRVIAIQKGRAGGFFHSFNGYNSLEAAYLDGISVTHGARGNRQHIWSFVGAFYEQDPSYRTDTTCPCSNTGVNWSRQVPSFINTNYFCDTGNRGPGISNTNYYTNDPLWDGQGCGSSSSCCTFNMPPWFCTTLPQATSDDLELRNCYADPSSHEDKIITLIDIYVK